MDFHKRLHFLRKEKGITQKDLADVLGYGYTAISNYESGKNEPSIRDIVKIADYFDVTIDYLVGRTDYRVSVENYKIEEFYKNIYRKITLLFHDIEEEVKVYHHINESQE